VKDAFNKYGKRLTEREFVNAVASIYPQTEEECRSFSEAEYRKRETNLMIDYHLGENYPQDKREILYNARERATKRFLSPAFIMKGLIVEMGLRSGAIKHMPGLDDADIDRGTRIMAEEFCKEEELETEDIIQFFDEKIEPAVRKIRGPLP
jgi:hypothetical protein